MIQRATDLYPRTLIDEYQRLNKKSECWIEWSLINEDGTFWVNVTEPTFMRKYCTTGGEIFGLYSGAMWIREGAKIFRISKSQCDALQKVEVNLTLEEYAQPYRALLVDFPDDRFAPYQNALCYSEGDDGKKLLLVTLNTVDHNNDITQSVAYLDDGEFIEKSLHRFDNTCAGMNLENASLALRVAVNACLALVHFGAHWSYLHDKEAVRDQRLVARGGECGYGARKRLKEAVKLVTFTHEVALHDETVRGESKVPGNGEVSCHWRRGHWAMQPYGPKNGLRKRILRKPVLVRADLFEGDLADTTTIYKG